MTDPEDSIRVLHVEDDPSFAELTTTFLERENERISVETATHAEEGLAAVRDGEIDCVVSDYDMPGRDGIEFLQVVREDYPDLPFVLFTGKGSEDVAADAISAGVTDYLQKETGSDQFALLANRVVNAVEHYRSERGAEHARTQLEAISKHSTDAIVIIDTDSRIQYANVAVEDHFGYAPDELEGESLLTIMPERYHERHLEAFGRYLETGERGVNWSNVEFYGLRRDGSEIPLSVSFSEFEQAGEDRFIGIMRDVSERTQMEEELRDRDDLFEQLADHIQDVVWMTDPEKDEMRFVSPPYEEIWGRSAESLYENPRAFVDAIHPDDRERVEAALERQASGDYDEEYRIRQPDGEIRWVRDRAFPIANDADEVDRIVGIATDITERRRRERELEEEKVFMEQSLDVLQDIFFVFDQAGNFIRWNEKVSELSDYSDDEIANMDPEEFFPEDHRERIGRTFQEILETGTGKVQADVESKDGERIPHEFVGTRIEDADGNIIGLAGVGRDISERQEREAELVRTRDLLEQTERIADVGGWELETESNDVFWTDHLFEVFGVDYHEAPPLEEALSFYHDEDRPTVERGIEQAITEREPYDIEVRFERGNDQLRWLRILGTPIVEDGTVVSVRGAVQDITDQKQYQRRLERQNERLEKFASFVSHDLRNPLNVAQLRLEQVQTDCSSEYLDDVDDALERMNGLISALLALAREGETATDISTVDLGDLSAACWQTVDTRGASHELEAVGRIRADENRLRQVIENLVRNAIEHGGEDVTVRIGSLPTGFYVEDDGPGIPAEDRDTVFDMGYSTTEGGTGFGLSIVQEIVEAHGWELGVTEGIDGGARFEITGVEFVDE